MSYLVLARKWRPQRFEDLVGQEHVSRTLKNAIASDRVHHAFLFTGARGVGKTSAARIFAKALNCETGPTSEPCGVCSSCEGITASNDVDVFEIDGASNTGVDDIRELRDSIRYLPSRSRYKIFIIDEVHMLSINAFNALLKTLEEPPEHAKFIFATTEPQKIPVTILSRCQRFDFRKIAQAPVIARLRQIADAESIDISDRALQMIAKTGGGSMRDSLSTLDQVLAFCGDKVDDAEVLALLGAVDHRLLLDVAEAVVQSDGRRVLDGLRRVDEQGYSWRQFARELVDLFRSLMVLQVASDPAELLDAGESELNELSQLGERATLEQVQRILTLLMKAEAELPHATFPRLVLELVLLRLTEMPDAQSISDLLTKLDQLQNQWGERPQAAAAPVSPAPAPVNAAPTVQRSPEPTAIPMPVDEPIASEPVMDSQPAASVGGGQGWSGLVDDIRQKRPAVASHLEHARLMELELPKIVLGYPAGSFHMVYMSETENLQNLESLAQSYFGQPVKIRLSPLTEDAEVPPSLAETREVEQQNRQEKLQQDAREHPAIQSAVEIFDGKVERIDPIEPGNES